jgi:hypothetical protein
MNVAAVGSRHARIDVIRTNTVRITEPTEGDLIQDIVADRVADAIVPYIKKSRRI